MLWLDFLKIINLIDFLVLNFISCANFGKFSKSKVFLLASRFRNIPHCSWVFPYQLDRYFEVLFIASFKISLTRSRTMSWTQQNKTFGSQFIEVNLKAPIHLRTVDLT